MKNITALLRLSCLWLSAGFLLAQTGSIRGTLTDPSGSAIPNAKVIALDEAKGLTVRETTSGNDGVFVLNNVQPGLYTIKSEVAGFKTLERTNLRLDQNQIMNLGTVTLQVGQTTDSVTVQAEVPLVETSTANKAFTVDARQVTQLALNGRDFQSLIRTLPGVVSNDRTDFRLAFNNTDAFNINGLRGSSNNVFLDGTINTDVGANDGQYTQISLDAVGEFKVQTSVFNAEYGRNPGVMIAVNTKSGTRQFHGTLYEFGRNNALDARQPFDRTGSTQKLRFNQFGANIGGPLWVPKISTKANPRLFFFFNYEKTLATRPSGGSFVDLPHPDLLNGDLSRLYRAQPLLTTGGAQTGFQVGQVFRPGTLVREGNGRIIGGDPYPNNQVPRGEWSRNATGFLNVLKGAPYGSVTGGTPNTPEGVRTFFQDSYQFNKEGKVLRLDYNISAMHNFFFRWADDANHEAQGLGIFASTPYPVFPQFRRKPGSSWSYNLVSALSPRTTNEFIFGYNRLTQLVDVNDTVASVDKYDQTKLGFTFQQFYPESNLRNRFPRFNCGVASCNYPGFPAGWLSEAKQFAWTDNMTMNRGSHTIKVGGFFNMNLNGQQPSWTDVMNFNFGDNTENTRSTGNTFANMLLGNYTSVGMTNGRFFGTFRFFGIEGFAQDSWRVNRKLTLEMGMRWAYMGPTYTYGKYLQNYFDPRKFDPAQAAVLDINPGLRNGSIIRGNPFNGMVEEGKGGLPLGGVNHRFNNWAPRIGFAYDPFGDGKTSIRGGGGMFYERIRQNANNFDGLGNPPLTFTPTVFSGQVDSLSASQLAGGVRTPVSVVGFDSKGQSPTVYSWSLGIQRQLGSRTSIDTAYVGNAGRYLQYRRDLNQLPLGTTLKPGVLASVNGTTNALRPYLGYTSVNWTDFGANSQYNGLQTRISRRFAQGLTGNFNHTWSRSFSETDGDTTAIGYYADRTREYGPAGFDRLHTVTIDFVYDLPNFAKTNAAAKYLVNGWQLGGITRFWGGTPLTVTSGGNPGTLGGGVRSDYLSGDVTPAQKSELDYFNVFAFGRPVDGSLGNTGKGILRGPGINQWDISVFKNTKITERVNVQLRIESFNTLNHTQWAGVNTGLGLPNPNTAVTTVTRGTLGQVNSTRDPRSLQLALKLLF